MTCNGNNRNYISESRDARGSIVPLDAIFRLSYIRHVAYQVEYTDEFAEWWDRLDGAEQDAVTRVVRLLEERGPTLPFPYSSGVIGSKFKHMRELRIQHEGRPYRVLYAFDPRSAALLLIGGDKTGNSRWYDEYVPVADRLYEAHLKEIELEEEKRG